MKLKDSRAAYQEFSGKVSELARTLSFSSIAIIWVFKSEVETGVVIPKELFGPALFTVLALGLDLLQYISATVCWGVFSRRKELSGITPDDNFKAPPHINLPAIVFFYGKLASIFVAYILLFMYLFDKFR